MVSNKVDSYSEQTVLLKWYFYQTGLTPEAHQDLYDTLIKSLAEEPNSGLLNALMANIYGNDYALDFIQKNQNILWAGCKIILKSGEANTIH